jgi:hypothetical protein
MDQKAGYQFTLRELPVCYDHKTQLFTCDKEHVISILYSYYPLIYEKLCVVHPEIKLVPVKTTPNDGNQLDLNHISPEKPEKEVEPAKPKKKEAPKSKGGMMLNIKKGLKSLMYKITPKKLRKRFNMDDI